MLKARVDPQNGGSTPLDLTQKLQKVSKRDETNFQTIIKKQYKSWAPIKYSTLTYTYFMSCHSVTLSFASPGVFCGGKGATATAFSFSFLNSFFFYSSQSFVRIFMTSLVRFMSVLVWTRNCCSGFQYVNSALKNGRLIC